MFTFFKNLLAKPAPKTPVKEESPIDKNTIKLVQESFEKVKPIAATAAEIFYTKLFELDPKLKPLFPTKKKGAMADQGNKLMTMLGGAVAGLTALDKLIPVLEDLGRRHVAYRVEKAHYDTVGSALLQTLEAGLAEEFTPEVKQAWTTVYTVMAGVMIKAAY
ncbi:globin family protein [Flavicella sediminum]|uniref:globin family protein n=1 Tax=Flavicella sediminum TaxID=2585141 RepID=UPI001FB66C09|nr:globin family protein [Flavicella sediminum]